MCVDASESFPTDQNPQVLLLLRTKTVMTGNVIPQYHFSFK